MNFTETQNQQDKMTIIAFTGQVRSKLPRNIDILLQDFNYDSESNSTNVTFKIYTDCTVVQPLSMSTDSGLYTFKIENDFDFDYDVLDITREIIIDYNH